MNEPDNTVSFIAEKLDRQPPMTEDQREATRKRICRPLELLLEVKKLELATSHIIMDMTLEDYSVRKTLDELYEMERAIREDVAKKIKLLRVQVARKATGIPTLRADDAEFERFLIRESILRRRRKEEQDATK